ncbi:response regulator transcription factor [Protaetiibacter larvae]|uniref:Response regulator transcription factor n=1 Tax=Protaetiibacter larvae TaxID=2592654 RepID=A0A5C1Y5U9_9MICO|nr:response regulator transcription factor [Protaetiibacter larvae]QEO08778.1 response regulator transcription factor [Protaetiibacter larvae]
MNATARPIRVVLADRDPLVRLGLRTLLESEGEFDVVGEASDPAAALALAREREPELVVATPRLLELLGDRARPAADEAPHGARAGAERDPRLEELTDREFEIFRLIAHGCSNPELSARLYLAESTIKTHVGRILMKLGARDRVELVMRGYDTGVVGVGGPWHSDDADATRRTTTSRGMTKVEFPLYSENPPREIPRSTTKA